MRAISNSNIAILCLAILVIDILAFYWLQSITQLIGQDWLVYLINGLFWFFTIGLVSAIVILKVRLDRIHPQRKHLLITSLYGLTVSSFIPKVIFVIIISVLFFTNYVFSEQESLLVIPMVGLLSGFLPFFVILHAIFRALYRFKVHHLRIRTKLLPSDVGRIKLVHISDLHLGSFNFRYHILERAVKIINHLQPDFIFFSGDLVNNFAWELKGWSEVLQKLEAKHGKYAVLGNHDYGDYSSWKTEELKRKNFESIKYFYKKTDFRLLLNESERVDFKGFEIGIAGVENWGHPPFPQHGDLGKALKGLETPVLKILLSHAGLRLDLEKRRLSADGRPVTLTPHEYALLTALMSAPGRVFTREELLDRLYPQGDAVVIDRVVDVHIGKLRQKIEPDSSNPRFILTVRGIGYRFAAAESILKMWNYN